MVVVWEMGEMVEMEMEMGSGSDATEVGCDRRRGCGCGLPRHVHGKVSRIHNPNPGIDTTAPYSPTFRHVINMRVSSYTSSVSR